MMEKSLKYAIRDGQDLAAQCRHFAAVYERDGEFRHASYWREKARQHYARCRSMAGIEQEDYNYG